MAMRNVVLTTEQAELVERFHAEHARRFAHSDPADQVEIATFRLAAIGRMPDPDFADVARPASGTPSRSGSRRIWLDDAWTDTPIYQRDALGAGAAIAGPAVIEEAFTTLILPAGWRAEMHASGDLLATRTAR